MRTLEFLRVDSQEEPRDGWDLARGAEAETYNGDRLAVLLVREAVKAPGVKGKGWNHWRTPEDFLERVRLIAPIGLDPCGHPASHVKATREWWGPDPGYDEIILRLGDEDLRRDGLVESWKRYTNLGQIAFVNPPYSGGLLSKWACKLDEEGFHNDVEIVALLPAATDTEWMHRYVFNSATAGCFWKGRIQFENPPIREDGKKNGSSLANYLAYWGPRRESFFKAFDGCGELVRLRAPRQPVRSSDDGEHRDQQDRGTEERPRPDDRRDGEG